MDFSGRPGLIMKADFVRSHVGGFDVDLVREFFQGFVNHALVSLHIDNLRGGQCAPSGRGLFLKLLAARFAWPPLPMSVWPV